MDDPNPPDAQEPTMARTASERWQAYDRRLTELEIKLDANSAATERVEQSTRGIVDTMESWNGAMKAIESIGKALRPLTWIIGFASAVVGLWATIRYNWDNR